MVETISREEWHELLGRSRDLENRARWARQDGRQDEAEVLERTMFRLNRKIKNPRLLRVRGIDA